MLRKITDELVHCGLAYSPERRGMLVVHNNSVNVLPIRVSPTKEKVASSGQEDKDRALEDLMREQSQAIEQEL